MVSVIVPIYNMERYLQRAMDSLIAQTYQDWEAILVDDGSTDRSGRMADEMAARDTRFHVIHKENGGLSDARNAGMEAMTGQWLMFLDPDDFLHPQAMALCVDAALRDDSDMVAFTYDRRYRTLGMVRHFLHLGDATPHFTRYCNPEYRVTDNIFDYATEYSKPRNIERRWAVKHCQVWRCMYRTDSVRDIRFIRGINYEDFPWWSEVLLHIHRTTILNLPLYFYYPNPRSYILSANQSHKAESLRIAIDSAQHLYASAPEAKRKAWERNFIIPFEDKLRKKRNKA